VLYVQSIFISDRAVTKQQHCHLLTKIIG